MPILTISQTHPRSAREPLTSHRHSKVTEQTSLNTHLRILFLINLSRIINSLIASVSHLSLGVSKVCPGKYRACAWVDGKQVNIGNFTNEEDAALAYDEFIMYHHLDKPLNFTFPQMNNQVDSFALAPSSLPYPMPAMLPPHHHYPFHYPFHSSPDQPVTPPEPDMKERKANF